MKKIFAALVLLFLTNMIIGCVSLENTDVETSESMESTTYTEVISPSYSAETIYMEKSDYIKITPEEALELNPLYLDVRTRNEYDDGHIPGAIFLYINDVNEMIEETIPDKRQTIVVYCRTGRRSERAVHLLLDHGYTRVFDLGGINDWRGEIVDAYGRISYSYFGTLPDDIITPFQFTTHEQIINDQNLWFQFTLDGTFIESYNLLSHDRSRYSIRNKSLCISTITIRNSSMDYCQVITDLHTNNQFANTGNEYGLSFDDWNFDGYMDFSLRRYLGGSMRNNPSYYWLWDSDESMYIPCEELNQISWVATPIAHLESQRIYAYTRGGWAEHMRKFYIWENENLILKTTVFEHIFRHPDGVPIPERLPEDDNPYIYRFVVHELIDGEMVLIEDSYSVRINGETVYLDDFVIEPLHD